MIKNKIIHFAIPNGGYRDLIEAVNLKRSGVQSGVPDICIPLPNKSHHGLYIELKRKEGGRVSDSQQYWIDLLNKQGYLAVVCEGSDAAKIIIEKYIADVE